MALPGAQIFIAGLAANRHLVRMPDNVLVLSTSTFLHGLQRRKLIPDAEAILNRATAIRGLTALVDEAFATKGAEDALNAWTN